MQLTNHTKVTTDRLREIIAFVRPPGIANFDLVFKNSGDGTLTGYAYHGGTSYHRRNGKCPPLVTLRVPKWFHELTRRTPCYRDPRANDHRYGRPVRYSTGKGYMNSECFTEEEKLVHIIAHELRHLWQARVKRGRRVWGARGQFSERDADAYGIHMTREWRRR